MTYLKNTIFTEKKNIMIFIFFLIFIFAKKETAYCTSQIKKIIIIPVSGKIDPAMSAFIDRAVKENINHKDSLFIFEMDTFGGRVDSALKIVETISNISSAKTIAYVKTKAISAGALISLSCNQLYMRQNTTIGDCAPITYSNEGPKELGEKFQSPLRAKFRALAKKNNYSPTLSEAMVTSEMKVYKIIADGKTTYIESKKYDELSKKEKSRITSRKTVVQEGELLTMDDKEAHEYGFSQKSVSDLNDIIKIHQIENPQMIRIKFTWSETFVSFIASITPILILIGLGALYTEIKVPGFGAPGIIGILCLGLAFGSQFIVGLANYTELLIVLLGFILLGFEIFVIPGFGIAGIAGFIFIAVGMVLTLQDFVLPSFPWQKELLINNIIVVLCVYIFAFFSSLFALRFVLPKFSFLVKGPYLETKLDKSHADSKEVQKANVGDVGITRSFLRPSGKIIIGKNIFDAMSESDFIEKDTRVVITRIKGNHIIVSRKESE